ncbi:hypothetical protein IV203_035433 [Nitzschia inconspicua]|uniref:Uncharacterized protein n=1 Tax=Nitzschia inconspicua TaxID=303405 RepID=A0A9K3LDF8_9STRA|nr:hypothetical protein IV203_006777 [Nitzschia inconspicua]KAG7360334.1 hypothetical protein IV203_035433 [Nitzschia inconspicua]
MASLANEMPGKSKKAGLDETPSAVLGSASMKVASPDVSLPSMAETSYASSPEDEARLPSTRRTLFRMEDEMEQGYAKIKSLAESTRVRPSPSKLSPIKYETVLMGENASGISEAASIAQSTTSSETTAIPSWNLSQKEIEEREIDAGLQKFVLSPSSSPAQSPCTIASWKHRYHTLRGNIIPSRFSKEPGPVFEEARPFYAQKENVGYNDDDGFQKADGDENERKASPVMVEEPPEAATSCATALNLTPAQLAEMFLAFGLTTREKEKSSGQCDTACGNTATTASPSPDHSKNNHVDNRECHVTPARNSMGEESALTTPRICYLERENNAFKKIVEQDAHTILNLQRVLETHKQLCSLKEIEIVERQTELQLSEDRVVRLKKERADYMEREIELLETIKILKNEVDEMTMKATNHYMETELAAKNTLIESLQTRIADLELILKEKETVAFNLKTEVDYLKSQRKEEAESTAVYDEGCVGKDEEEEILPHQTSHNHQSRMPTKVLQRLEALEKANKEREDILLAALNRTNNEMELIRQHRSPGIEMCDTLINVSEDPQEIEAMAMNGKAAVRTKNDASTYGCCCSPFP